MGRTQGTPGSVARGQGFLKPRVRASGFDVLESLFLKPHDLEDAIIHEIVRIDIVEIVAVVDPRFFQGMAIDEKSHTLFFKA